MHTKENWLLFLPHGANIIADYYLLVNVEYQSVRVRERETVALLLLLADLVSLHLHHSLETHGEVRPIEVPILVFTDFLEAEQLRRTMHCAQA